MGSEEGAGGSCSITGALALRPPGHGPAKGEPRCSPPPRPGRVCRDRPSLACARGAASGLVSSGAFTLESSGSCGMLGPGFPLHVAVAGFSVQPEKRAQVVSQDPARGGAGHRSQAGRRNPEQFWAPDMSLNKPIFRPKIPAQSPAASPSPRRAFRGDGARPSPPPWAGRGRSFPAGLVPQSCGEEPRSPCPPAGTCGASGTCPSLGSAQHAGSPAPSRGPPGTEPAVLVPDPPSERGK